MARPVAACTPDTAHSSRAGQVRHGRRHRVRDRPGRRGGAARQLSRGPLESKAISTTLATIFTYLGSRFWTFKHRENQALGREAPLFIVLNLVGLLIAEVVIALVTYGFGRTASLSTTRRPSSAPAWPPSSGTSRTASGCSPPRPSAASRRGPRACALPRLSAVGGGPGLPGAGRGRVHRPRAGPMLSSPWQPAAAHAQSWEPVSGRHLAVAEPLTSRRPRSPALHTAGRFPPPRYRRRSRHHRPERATATPLAGPRGATASRSSGRLPLPHSLPCACRAGGPLARVGLVARRVRGRNTANTGGLRRASTIRPPSAAAMVRASARPRPVPSAGR